MEKEKKSESPGGNLAYTWTPREQINVIIIIIIIIVVAITTIVVILMIVY